eukprot:5994802-Alexandrium_andersonii.AAC.1
MRDAHKRIADHRKDRRTAAITSLVTRLPLRVAARLAARAGTALVLRSRSASAALLATTAASA